MQTFRIRVEARLHFRMQREQQQQHQKQQKKQLNAKNTG